MNKYIKALIRRRTIWLVGGSILVLLFMLVSDPNTPFKVDLGPYAALGAFVGQLSMPVLAVWFAFLSRKALFDYLDIEEVYNKAKESTVGAGLIFIGTCLVFFGLLGLFGGQVAKADVQKYVPSQAATYMPMLKQEQQTLWKDHPEPFYSRV